MLREFFRRYAIFRVRGLKLWAYLLSAILAVFILLVVSEFLVIFWTGYLAPEFQKATNQARHVAKKTEDAADAANALVRKLDSLRFSKFR
jgi:hypothetical protein